MATQHSSESESVSDPSIHSYKEVQKNGARKRRRVSFGEEREATSPSHHIVDSSFNVDSSTRHVRKTSPHTHNLQVRPEKRTFSDLKVDPWLVASLSAMAIIKPTAIQRGCIPEILGGRDCIGISRTGSGKTVAFAVPILQTWAQDPFGIFAIVLTPTRELALQIYEQFKAISAPQSLKLVLVTGGADMRQQALALSQRPHVVIATPGRLADHIRNSGEDTVCGIRRVRFVVFDEADRLFATGNGSMLPDIEVCVDAMPARGERQTCLFTATISDSMRQFPRAPGRPPIFFCDVDTEVLAIPPTLRQMYIKVPVTHRESYLHVLLQTPANVNKSVIIFCNSRKTAVFLEHVLRLLEHRVTALHSSLPQSERTSNLARFRAHAARILVATDVASRGLDIPLVGLVVNFDLPQDPDDYIHRVGRTARAGRSGESICVVGQRDVDRFLMIEERAGRKMEEFAEEGVSMEGRVIREGLKVVGEMKREALLRIEEGRDVKGKRRRGIEKRNKR